MESLCEALKQPRKASTLRKGSLHTAFCRGWARQVSASPRSSGKTGSLMHTEITRFSGSPPFPHPPGSQPLERSTFTGSHLPPHHQPCGRSPGSRDPAWDCIPPPCKSSRTPPESEMRHEISDRPVSTPSRYLQSPSPQQSALTLRCRGSHLYPGPQTELSRYEYRQGSKRWKRSAFIAVRDTNPPPPSAMASNSFTADWSPLIPRQRR